MGEDIVLTELDRLINFTLLFAKGLSFVNTMSYCGMRKLDAKTAKNTHIL